MLKKGVEWKRRHRGLHPGRERGLYSDKLFAWVTEFPSYATADP